jgi:hypothetical protein
MVRQENTCSAQFDKLNVFYEGGSLMTVSSSSKPTMIIVTAVVSAIVGIVNLCGSLVAITGGAFLGGAGAIANQISSESGQTLTAEEQAALNAVSAGGGALLTILGIVGLIIGIALLVDAVGLFQGKPWSWMLTIVLYGALIVIQVLTILSGGFGVISLVWIVVAGAIAFLFYTNADIKRALGQPV